MAFSPWRGYHNFHHEFVRLSNGVNPWHRSHKWTIWLPKESPDKVRKVPKSSKPRSSEKALIGNVVRSPGTISESLYAALHNAQGKMHAALAHWEELRSIARRNGAARSKTSPGAEAPGKGGDRTPSRGVQGMDGRARAHLFRDSDGLKSVREAACRSPLFLEMYDSRLDQLAKVLVRHSTKLQKGENALIELLDAHDEIDKRSSALAGK
jgi:hypothetical protein